MRVLFHDMYEDPKVQGRTRNELLNCNDLLYSDDTLLLTMDTRTMNAFLEAIERGSAYYNMKRNKGKCLTITMSGLSLTHFEDGTFLSNAPDSKCLGISLDGKTLPTHLKVLVVRPAESPAAAEAGLPRTAPSAAAAAVLPPLNTLN